MMKSQKSKRKRPAGISNCCGAPMRVGGERTTHFYVCTKCGKSCDPKPKCSRCGSVLHDDLDCGLSVRHPEVRKRLLAQRKQNPRPGTTPLSRRSRYD